MLIQQHGKPVYFESFGVRNPATGQPMTPDTLFQIYSMTKAVTSVAAMMLVDDGKLGLDDPVEKYIRSFADTKVGVDVSDEAGKYPLKLEPLKRPITIRDLLRHTSGITYGFFGEQQVTKLYGNPLLYAGDFDNAEFVDRIAVLPLAEQPGTRWNYSHSTDVLGRVVEVASGQTLFQFEKQRLFDPLGMSETAYVVADSAKWPRIAQAFPVDRFRVAGIGDPTLPRRWESGGAGLVSTIGDYARFLQMLLNGGELDGKRYLKPETVKLMTSDQIGPETGIIHDPFYFPGPTSGFGLGFAVRTSAPPGTTWPLGEYRWDGAGGSFYFVDPVDDLFGDLHGDGAHTGRADSAGPEDDDVRGAGQGPAQGLEEASHEKSLTSREPSVSAERPAIGVRLRQSVSGCCRSRNRNHENIGRHRDHPGGQYRIAYACR